MADVALCLRVTADIGKRLRLYKSVLEKHGFSGEQTLLYFEASTSQDVM